MQEFVVKGKLEVVYSLGAVALPAAGFRRRDPLRNSHSRYGQGIAMLKSEAGKSSVRQVRGNFRTNF